MSDKETVDRLKAQGLEVETVGNLLGDEQAEPGPAEPVTPPRLEGQPEFPEPGIYFGMPEDQYHAIHAVSASGLKKLAISTMDYWANSPLNPEREDDEKAHLNLGKAIHALVLEGEEAYVSRFAISPEPSDFDGPVLISTDEIKAAISRHTKLQPVRPQGGSKDELEAQLRGLCAKHDRALSDVIPSGMKVTVALLKEAIMGFEEDAPIKPVAKVEDVMDGEPYMRAASKEDWIDQLLGLDPSAKVWDRIMADYLKAHEGKTLIPAKIDRRIRVAAKMIRAHPELAKALSGGFPEVSVFWYCPETGVPCKVRFDYLKMRFIADLKSFANAVGMPVDRAIERTIANYRYNLQHAFYVEAAMQARRLIREAPLMYPPIASEDDCPDDEHQRRFEFAEQWARQDAEPAFLFIFQQTGIAPVTRGKWMPTGTVYSVTRSRIHDLKLRWKECAATYGTDPWIDVQPIDTIEDEAIPLHATEI